MAGNKPRKSDEEVIRVWNDVARFARVADVMAELGYAEEATFRKRITKLRKALGADVVIVRADHYRQRPHAYTPNPASPDPRVGSRWLVAAKPKRWLLTSAQDETQVDEAFWTNLLAYADFLGAEVMVGGFTYNKSLFEDHAARSGVFAECVRPYLRHESVWCGPLRFAAEMNILPTAVRPLSGLENYGQGAWTVFPHAKVQLVSVPSLPGKHPALVMTTGACTIPNYIAKKAGLKAEFHHQIGATIVEVDGTGNLFCRQIVASADGNFQDLDVLVRGGAVTTGNRVEAISWGDIHREQLDPVVARACWGFDADSETVVSSDSMVQALRPRHQFFHDLLDFRARNHHRRGDHVHAIGMHVAGAERVEEELALSSRFLRATAFDWCQSVVVPSNHNAALLRWLREIDPRSDPLNLETWCELNLEWHRRIKAGDEQFDLIHWALARHDPRALDDMLFVPPGGSYLVCQAHGGIECGLHGHEGPNGARGSAANLNRMSVRMNIGHAHSASILDGVYTAGLCGLLDQGYNASAPSGWSHTQIVTYPSSRRTLVTIQDGKWRA